MSENGHDKKEIDQVSGIETTGHDWDGLKELNNPAPRWWLWVFYVCVIWSIGYWIVFPAWPTITGHTEGTFEWTQYKKLTAEQAEITARQETYMAKFKDASFDEIMNNPGLYAFAVAGGSAAFKNNCAMCHGNGAAGGKGYPNLNDDDWLWGGKIGDIYQTIEYGIRSGHDKTRLSEMPAFGRDGLLKQEEMLHVADYVLALGAGKADDPSMAAGKEIFAKNCTVCHGNDGTGGRSVGAPNLTDKIWLYGGDKETIYKTIYGSRKGVMPYWAGRLDEQTIRQLAVYVHTLGGGEKDVPVNEQPPAAIPASEPAATAAD